MRGPILVPNASNGSANGTASAAGGWGLRIVRSHGVVGYGVGLYIFSDNCRTGCSKVERDAVCQKRVLGVERSGDVGVYNLNTVGLSSMVTVDEVDRVGSVNKYGTFVDTVVCSGFGG